MKSFRLYPMYWMAWCLISFSALSLGVRPAFAQLPQAATTIGPIQLFDQPEIDAGFQQLYLLKFPEARATFMDWENQHPDEPLGAAPCSTLSTLAAGCSVHFR
jgi:hypothetical protein